MVAPVQSQEPRRRDFRPKPDLTEEEIAHLEFLKWLIEHGKITDDPLHEGNIPLRKPS